MHPRTPCSLLFPLVTITRCSLHKDYRLEVNRYTNPAVQVVMASRIASKRLCLIPGTFMISSIVPNGPCCVRKLTIARAVVGPMPGRVSSSASSAVLIFICDADAAGNPAASNASPAPAPSSRRTRRSPRLSSGGSGMRRCSWRSPRARPS